MKKGARGREDEREGEGYLQQSVPTRVEQGEAGKQRCKIVGRQAAVEIDEARRGRHAASKAGKQAVSD
ncbi:hypothetical protein ACLOJK_017030 [Asimina triloba]